MNKLILHLEGATILTVSLLGYMYFQYNWWIFLIFLLSPDLAMLGYLINRKIGAIIYNICHTYILSLILLFLGLVIHQELFVLIGLIWTAHIGMDRAFGFGLKYPTQFNATHMDRV